MSESSNEFKQSKNMSFFSTGSELFVRLNNILILPFGNRNDYINSGENSIEFEHTAIYGTYFKIKYPCAIIDLNSKEPLRLKDIPKLIPEKVKPITDDEFKGKGKNYKYYCYLRDIYKKWAGPYDPRTKEEEFIDLYFELCWKQLSERERLWKEIEYDKDFEKKYDPSNYSAGEYSLMKSHMYYQLSPINDGRWVYEALLPIHEPHLFFKATGFMNKMEQEKTSVHEIDEEGYLSHKQYLVPSFENSQENKNLLRHTRIDFAFWTGEGFLFYEIDGDKKKFAEHIQKHEDILESGNFLKRLTNSNVNTLKNVLSEYSCDYHKLEDILSDVFPTEILKYWESTPADSPLHKLYDDSFAFHEGIEKGCSEPYMSLHFHLREISMLDFRKNI